MPTDLHPNEVKYAHTPITIDGKPDSLWDSAPWQAIDQLILGVQPTAADFSGRYKLLWREDKLYLLAEIVDDVLFDKTAVPTSLYWDDDCLEVFIDQDASGGEHQFNHNAFAYHVALDNQVADFNRSQQAQTFNQHVQSRWQRDTARPEVIYWELAISIFPDDYNDKLAADDAQQVSAVNLKVGDIIGFMVAYCDNDGSNEREMLLAPITLVQLMVTKTLATKQQTCSGTLNWLNNLSSG
ncbi:CBM9 family sugar-binding protein [Shewanella sp. FYR11-62]|uniref:CBM9 family sugar-binding protein n=1 Tax=Shewanella subflava TaxID=2986476 RepID=A0ABT3IC27_9GAMM|nr:CBM9 family sugar-binding protein [Shewanella subflava]MCW3173453.1 CBM9 family sugar-binding protein [Shewanella subflava]